MLAEHPCRIRERLRRALCHLGKTQGTVYRPGRDAYGGLTEARTLMGCVAGYPYEKARSSGAIVIALPGQLDEQDRAGSRLMALYGCRDAGPPGTRYDPPQAQRDDILVMEGGATYRVTGVTQVMGGAYHLYDLKEA